MRHGGYLLRRSGRRCGSGGDGQGGTHLLGEGAVVMNRGLILIDGPGATGVEGVIVNTHVINKGTIRIEGERSFGLA